VSISEELEVDQGQSELYPHRSEKWISCAQPLVEQMRSFMRNIVARDVMIKDVHTITGDRKVAYARLMMLRHNVGALPVVDDENVVLGIITQRDIDLAGADVSDLLVSDLMTRSLIKAKETTTLRWIVERMIKTGVQRIPVLDENSRLLGLVTQTTVIKAALMFNLLK